MVWEKQMVATLVGRELQSLRKGEKQTNTQANIWGKQILIEFGLESKRA